MTWSNSKVNPRRIVEQSSQSKRIRDVEYFNQHTKLYHKRISVLRLERAYAAMNANISFSHGF